MKLEKIFIKNDSNTNIDFSLNVKYNEVKDDCILFFELNNSSIKQKIKLEIVLTEIRTIQSIKYSTAQNGKRIEASISITQFVVKFIGCLAIELLPEIIDCYKKNKIRGRKLDWEGFLKCLRNKHLPIDIFNCIGHSTLDILLEEWN